MVDYRKTRWTHCAESMSAAVCSYWAWCGPPI
jgi:hypothetical protein